MFSQALVFLGKAAGKSCLDARAVSDYGVHWVSPYLKPVLLSWAVPFDLPTGKFPVALTGKFLPCPSFGFIGLLP
jgi:hypothetical protein